MRGFPASPRGGTVTTSGIRHLTGAVGFPALAAATVAYTRWCTSGVGLLWLAVLPGWLWLAVAATHLYTVVPHPVLSQRTGAPARSTSAT